MDKRVWTGIAVAFALGVTVCAASAQQQPKDIRWGTPPVGTSGHKALVVLADMLNKEMPKYRITVQPTPGAIVTVKGYATGEFDGYYGSDIAFYELANDINRFKGFKESIKRQPMQSFWVVHDRGRPRRSTPATRTSSRGGATWPASACSPGRALGHARPARARARGARHQVTNTCRSTWRRRARCSSAARIDGHRHLHQRRGAPPPWIAEASLATDWAALNPSAGGARRAQEGRLRHRSR